ncbi:MAG: glycosyltransferase [Planctomycetes bacterium]|nr:glycosyltransferase [Planctomycetota bacterium]
MTECTPGPMDSGERNRRTATPRVSVIVPAYNHERFIGKTIESVLAQTFEEWELIVIDDGSSDNTAEIVRAFDDPRIHFESQGNIGAAPTINRGIGVARGEFVCVLNSDDVFAPSRMERLLREFADEPSLDAVFTHLEFIDDDGKLIRRYEGPAELWRDMDCAPSFAESEHLVLQLLAGNFVCTTSNLFCRRTVFDRLPPFKDLRYVHDHEFFLRLCYHLRVRVVPEALVSYRIHAQNTIKENEAQTDYELALVLADFLTTHDITRFLPSKTDSVDIESSALALFHSLNARSATQLMFALLSLNSQGVGLHEWLVAEMEARGGRMRSACTKHFAEYIDSYASAQDAWARWREANERLLAAKEEHKSLFAENQSTWSRLNEVNHELEEAASAWKESQQRIADLDTRLAESLAENEKLWKRYEAERLSGESERAASAAERANIEAERLKSEQFWKDGQEAWKQVEELNVRVTELDRKLGEQLDREKSLWQQHQETEKNVATLNNEREALASELADLRAEHERLLMSMTVKIGKFAVAPWSVAKRVLGRHKPDSDER